MARLLQFSLVKTFGPVEDFASGFGELGLEGESRTHSGN